MKILITAALTAHAYQLKRILDASNTVVLGDSGELPQMPGGTNLIKLPAGSSPSFSHLLLTLCLDLDINKVYPLRREEITALAEARKLFDEYGITVIVPQKDRLNSLDSTQIKGTIIIRDETSDGDLPDRGIFIVDALSKQFQLFTAD